ncbi:MAG: tRNA (guanosine(37)-N1)-methyltransferase TrmD [Syntrophomonadaceae bacterium]|nr:tRNA (guanosine(37)-N1)-methyltransferase TrmD [Syntrophomonadaceae bacterium]
MRKYDILTLFPQMFVSPFTESIIKRAQEKELVEINTINIRDFAPGRQRQVDDYPYGGGAGMVMKADVLGNALDQVTSAHTYVVYMSPQGTRLNQEKVRQLSQYERMVILCGHYEGVDARIFSRINEEISIGDYILTGGEIPAMVLLDAIIRLIPGVLGDENSTVEESFSSRWLEYPQYTRPAEYEGQMVPGILLSGHHENIRRYRKKQSLLTTLLKRPDLLLNRKYDAEERQLLEEILFNGEQVE